MLDKAREARDILEARFARRAGIDPALYFPQMVVGSHSAISGRNQSAAITASIRIYATLVRPMISTHSPTSRLVPETADRCDV